MADAISALKSAARTEILTEKALRYKRTAMGLGLVVFAIQLAPVDFTNLGFAGVRLEDNIGNKRIWALLILWSVLIYNVVWAAYFCWRDWRRWKADLLEKRKDPGGGLNYFPELRMYWKRTPREGATRSRVVPGGEEFVRWHPPTLNNKGRMLEFSCAVKNRAGEELTRGTYSVPVGIVREVQERLYAFLILEIGAAAICFGLPLGALLIETEGWLQHTVATFLTT